MLFRSENDKDETQWRVDRFSRHLACTSCGKSYEVLNPHNYSFNSSLGWCQTCEGLGFQRGANVNLLIGDGALSLRNGAITAWPTLDAKSPFLPFAEALVKHVGFSLDTPYDQLDGKQQRAILQGTGDDFIPLTRDAKTPGIQFQYKGLFPAIDEASRVSFVYRMKLEHLVDEIPCSACHGSRLRPDAAATRFHGLTLGELCHKPLGDSLQLFEKLKLTKRDKDVIGCRRAGKHGDTVHNVDLGSSLT